ncbi:MAG: hypothetical protein ACUVWA_15215 [Candidatus Oleimicrobiaceae bacterium]
MSWDLFRWVWLLESPLFIGSTPAGSLNRCRLYVPARALWGVLTAEIAWANATAFPNYVNIGDQLHKEARFTYLYPAEKVGDGWRIWLPRYEKGKGLIWRREDSQNTVKALPDRQMRMRLLSTRSGTAIDPSSDTATEGTLRESEYINTHWRSADGNAGSPIAMVGYVFLERQGIIRNHLQKITSVIMGGDTRYGFGRLRRIDCSSETTVFRAGVDLNDPNHPVIESEVLYAHAGNAHHLVGNRELLVGWDNANGKRLISLSSTPDPLWTPGSTVETTVRWKVERNGLWEVL